MMEVNDRSKHFPDRYTSVYYSSPRSSTAHVSQTSYGNITATVGALWGESGTSQSSTLRTFGSSGTSATSTEGGIDYGHVNGHGNAYSEPASGRGSTTTSQMDMDSTKKKKKRSKKSRGGKKRREIKVVGEDMANYTAPTQNAFYPQGYQLGYMQGVGSRSPPPMPPPQQPQNQYYPPNYHPNMNVCPPPQMPQTNLAHGFQPPLPHGPPRPPQRPPCPPSTPQPNLPQVINPQNDYRYLHEQQMSSAQIGPAGPKMYHAASSHEGQYRQQSLPYQKLEHRSYSTGNQPTSEQRQWKREFRPQQGNQHAETQYSIPPRLEREAAENNFVVSSGQSGSSNPWAVDPSPSNQRGDWTEASPLPGPLGSPASAFPSTIDSIVSNNRHGTNEGEKQDIDDDAGSVNTLELMVGDEENDIHSHESQTHTEDFWSNFVVFSTSLDQKESMENFEYSVSGERRRDPTSQDASVALFSEGRTDRLLSQSFLSFEDNLSSEFAKNIQIHDSTGEPSTSQSDHTSQAQHNLSEALAPNWEPNLSSVGSTLFSENMAPLASIASEDVEDEQDN